MPIPGKALECIDNLAESGVVRVSEVTRGVLRDGAETDDVGRDREIRHVDNQEAARTGVPQGLNVAGGRPDGLLDDAGGGHEGRIGGKAFEGVLQVVGADP